MDLLEVTPSEISPSYIESVEKFNCKIKSRHELKTM